VHFWYLSSVFGEWKPMKEWVITSTIRYNGRQYVLITRFNIVFYSIIHLVYKRISCSSHSYLSIHWSVTTITHNFLIWCLIRFQTIFILNLKIQAQGVNETVFRLFFEIFDCYIRKFEEYKYEKLMRILLIVVLSVNDIFETEISLTVKRFG